MIHIEKNQDPARTRIHIITNGSTSEYVAMLKTLTNSLANAESQEDKEVLGCLITNMLPNEKQLKLE